MKRSYNVLVSLAIFSFGLVLISCSGGDGGGSSSLIANDSGTLDETETLKTWTYPSSLDDYINPPGTYVYPPQMAMDDNGNAIMVWYQYDGQFSHIYKSEYRNGVWTHPSGIDDDINPVGVGDPYATYQVAMDNNGNAIIVWMLNYRIYMSEYRNGIWSHPTSLSDYINPDGDNTYAGDPQVALDDKGNAIIVWAQLCEGNTSRIFKSEYRNGVWTHPASLDDYISPDDGISNDEYINPLDAMYSCAYFPKVAMDNSGNAIVVWQQESEGNPTRVYKSEYRDGSWIHPSGSNDFISSDDAYGPQVAMADNGDAVIVWRQNTVADSYQIFMCEYRSGNWIYPTDGDDHISPSGDTSGIGASSFDVTMDSSGNTIIVWEQYAGSDYQVFKSEYRSGAWIHPSDIDAHINLKNQDFFRLSHK